MGRSHNQDYMAIFFFLLSNVNTKAVQGGDFYFSNKCAIAFATVFCFRILVSVLYSGLAWDTWFQRYEERAEIIKPGGL